MNVPTTTLRHIEECLAVLEHARIVKEGDPARCAEEMIIGYFEGGHSSPRAASALMRFAVRQAIAWMVSDGLTPPTVGNTEPSQTQ